MYVHKGETPGQLIAASDNLSGLGRNPPSLAQCPAGTQSAKSYKPPFSSAERHITEQDAPEIFKILCGPSPWQHYLRTNLSAHLRNLPQRPILILPALAQRYKAVFGVSLPADARGFVDRRNATIYLEEFPAGNVGKSLVGLALHEAVHLFSHPPGKSNQRRATAYAFLGVGLLEGLTQVVTEDIQAAQGIRPLRSRWQAYQEYTPVARRFIQIFTPALVGNAYFNGSLEKLLRVIEKRWTFNNYLKVKSLTDQKKTQDALRFIGSLETVYLNRPKPKIRELRWVFRGGQFGFWPVIPQVQVEQARPDLGVSARQVKEYDWVFEKEPGRKFKDLVEWAARKIELNPGLLAVNLIAETRRDDYLSKRPVSSFVVGTDDFFDKRHDLARKVPAFADIGWDKKSPPTIDVNEQGRRVRSISFNSGRDALLGSAVYLKHGEVILRDAAAKAGRNFGDLPIETRFALVRLAFNAGHGRALKNLQDALKGRDILIRKRQKKAGPQRRATIHAARAIYLSQEVFGVPAR